MTADELHTEAQRRQAVLSAEYATWNRSQGLDLGSADEAIFEEGLKPEQYAYLRRFSRLWEDTAAPYICGGRWHLGELSAERNRE